MSKRLAQLSASSRTAKVVERVNAALALMEAEIKSAGGRYPGRLSLNEVCRRAGVHPITMQGSAHDTTTKPMVMAWLAARKRTTATSKRAVSSSDSTRAKEVETDLRELAAHFRLRENEIPRLNEEIEELRKRVAALESENLELRAIASDGVITKIRKRDSG